MVTTPNGDHTQMVTTPMDWDHTFKSYKKVDDHKLSCSVERIVEQLIDLKMVDLKMMQLLVIKVTNYY